MDITNREQTFKFKNKYREVANIHQASVNHRLDQCDIETKKSRQMAGLAIIMLRHFGRVFRQPASSMKFNLITVAYCDSEVAK